MTNTPPTDPEGDPGPPAGPGLEDEQRAIRMILAIVSQDEAAARIALNEAHDRGREALLLIALARYGAKLSESSLPATEDQLRAMLLGMAATATEKGP